MAWSTPVYQADFDGAGPSNRQLRAMILDAEKTDPQAAPLQRPIEPKAVKSSQNLLTWDHPAIGWVRDRITDAVTALTSAELGEAAREADSAPSGPKPGRSSTAAAAACARTPTTTRPGAGCTTSKQATPAAAATPATCNCSTPARPRSPARHRPASSGYGPAPGRMVAFPGWLPHSVQATATGDSLRICIAWNVAYDKTWSPAP